MIRILDALSRIRRDEIRAAEAQEKAREYFHGLVFANACTRIWRKRGQELWITGRRYL